VTARWVIASGNRGKLAELTALLAAADLGPLELVAQTDLGVPPADETAITFLENALAKARHAARHTGLPAIADDSGLAVAALGGAPGVRSARFAGAAANDRPTSRSCSTPSTECPPAGAPRAFIAFSSPSSARTIPRPWSPAANGTARSRCGRPASRASVMTRVPRSAAREDCRRATSGRQE